MAIVQPEAQQEKFYDRLNPRPAESIIAIVLNPKPGGQINDFTRSVSGGMHNNRLIYSNRSGFNVKKEIRIQLLPSDLRISTISIGEVPCDAAISLNLSFGSALMPLSASL